MKSDYIESIKFRSGAYYTIKRDGQELPDKGDRVRVVVTLYIPATQEEGGCYYIDPHIKPELRFGGRVTIAGGHLGKFWGTKTKDNTYQYRKAEFCASTWRDAFEQASVWAETELQKLDDALAMRERARQAAERPPTTSP